MVPSHGELMNPETKSHMITPQLPLVMKIIEVPMNNNYVEDAQLLKYFDNSWPDLGARQQCLQHLDFHIPFDNLEPWSGVKYQKSTHQK